jgi:hypothetical protein
LERDRLLPKALSKEEYSKFKEDACDLFNTGDFPQATFYFFQHKVHNGSGKPYPALEIANSRCDSRWNGLLEFLEQEHFNGMIEKTTPWKRIQSLWYQHMHQKKDKVNTSRACTLQEQYTSLERMLNTYISNKDYINAGEVQLKK